MRSHARSTRCCMASRSSPATRGSTASLGQRHLERDHLGRHHLGRPPVEHPRLGHHTVGHRGLESPPAGLARPGERCPQIRVGEGRLALEPAAAALAAERMTKPDHEALRALRVELRDSRTRPDATQFLRADQVFHRAVADFAQNALLAEYMDHIQTLNLWMWNTYFETHGVRRHDLFAHEPIVEALLNGDAAGDEAAMREHIAR